MKLVSASSSELNHGRYRVDASYYASTGVRSESLLLAWKRKKAQNRLQSLGDLCGSNGMFVGDWLKRIYVNSPDNGAPYIAGSDILNVDPKSGGKYLSFRHGDYIKQLSLRKGMILMTCSGSIGNFAYVNEDFLGAVGSPDLLRIVPDDQLILPGYLFCFLNSEYGKSLILKGIYGGVIQHIEIPYVKTIPVPRLDKVVEQKIHDLIEQASYLRVNANALLKQSRERFYREVLGIEMSGLNWKAGHVDAFAVGKTSFKTANHRLDAFHYVGYAGEAVKYLGRTQPMGDLVEPYQPNLFKRPYTKENGIPFLTGVDLYNAYPKPHMYISRKMKGLDSYCTSAGTILVQHAGQRYGLFGQPTILLKHLDGTAVTEHLFRIYPKVPSDRGFVYVWLTTEIGRRLLLKQSFGTSMGLLANESFRAMPIPICSPSLRNTFEFDVQSICEMREKAIGLEDQAQFLLISQISEV
jgi:type I restriction enzyme, S subunit